MKVEEINAKIKANLKTNLLKWKSKFQNIDKIDNKLDELKIQLNKIDFDQFKIETKDSIISNVTEWWQNQEKGIDLTQELLAILFEYNVNYVGDKTIVICDAYGLVEWKNHDIYLSEFEMGFDYDFATEFYALPAFSMNYLNTISKLELKDFESISEEISDIEDIKGYTSLLNIYKYKGYIQIQAILEELESNGVFDKLNRKKGFSFLIQEHDELYITPLLIK